MGDAILCPKFNKHTAVSEYSVFTLIFNYNLQDKNGRVSLSMTVTLAMYK